MFKSVLNTLREKQPIAFTGIFAHTYYWLTSALGDQVYQNPSYKGRQDVSDKEGIAIYFIHGTGDRPGAFQLIAERLIQAGLPDEVSSLHLISFEQRYHGKSIRFFAEQLREKIGTNKHQRVILIGHSRGGLVASYFTEFLAPLDGVEVPLVMAVGAPFNGSYLAIKPLSWFSDSIREMEVESDFLAQLKQQIVTHTTSDYYFFIATEDTIVPGASAYIQEYVAKYPRSLITLDRHGHLSMMSSHRLVSVIADLLHHYFKPIAVGVSPVGDSLEENCFPNQEEFSFF